MIDPNRVTNTARTREQLEEFLLFCVVVAGKNADQQAAKLERFLRRGPPFETVRQYDRKGILDARLREERLGKYTLLGESLRQIVHSKIDLSSCSWESLTQFPGIGIKTAKFFTLHSRPAQMHGVLDTHVLAWMGEHWTNQGLRAPRVPEHSPQDPRTYAFWETLFFGMAALQLRQEPGAIDWAKFDLDLWRQRRGSAD